MQILIRFPNEEIERKALGKLIPRFSGKSWASGETAVSGQALGFLAEQGIKFTVLDPNLTAAVQADRRLDYLARSGCYLNHVDARG